MMKLITQKNYRSFDTGTKAKNLFIMMDSDIPVPPAVCIDSTVFRQNDETARLLGELSKRLDFTDNNALETACTEMKDAVRNSLTDIINGIDIDEIISLLGNGSVSVRSSSSAEDSGEHSFAGQFDTYLNVEPQDIKEKILNCVLSKYNPGVVKYCCDSGIDIASIGMNVIIQKMVMSDMSGVMFTSNPQGLLNESVIAVGAGTGDNVVEDRVPVTTYYYNTTDKNYCYDRACDAVMLPSDKLEELIEISQKLKHVFGEYLDIEFAVEGNKIWILQVRPITTLDVSQPVILDNSNIVESYPGLSLPLSATFALEAYTGVFKGVARRFISEKTLLRYDAVLSDMVTCVNGRMYYKISNWYTVIKFLPFSKKIIPVWQEMMGVGVKSYDDSTNGTSPLERVGAYINTVKAAFTVRKQMEKLGEVYDEVERYFTKTFSNSMSNEQLLQLYETIAEKLLAKWDVTLINDMYAFCFTGLLKSLMKDCPVNGAANDLISGLGNLESMKPLREIIRLSEYASTCNGEVETMRLLKTEAQAKTYLSRENELCRRLNAYINLFGDRCPEELKLESVTFRTSKLSFLKKIVEYADAGDSLKNIGRKRDRVELTNELTAGYSFIKRRLIKFVWERAAAGIRNREESRLDRCRIYGMVREIFTAASINLTQQGRLNNERDIFYCTCNEIFEALNGDNGTDLNSLVASRQKKYECFKKIPPCSRLVFAGQPYDKSIIAEIPGNGGIHDNVLYGTPCSGGKLTAEVEVVETPGSAGDVRGKIIVARTTDPGWVFLLTLAGGIIAEKGSLLSHTAIISREIGIPSVVGVKDAASFLKSGDTVTLDGDTGEIKIIK